jgi:hypothetical protein
LHATSSQFCALAPGGSLRQPVWPFGTNIPRVACCLAHHHDRSEVDLVLESEIGDAMNWPIWQP